MLDKQDINKLKCHGCGKHKKLYFKWQELPKCKRCHNKEGENVK